MSTQEIHLVDEPPTDIVSGKAISRRSLLETGVWATTGVIGLTLAGAGGRFLVGNALVPAERQWVALGQTAKLPANQMHIITYKKRSKDAWRRTERPGLLYVYSEDGADYRALDAACTHLGCNVHWKEESNRFYCACHDAFFSQQGEVVSGPPPAPLQRIETKVEEGVLYALL